METQRAANRSGLRMTDETRCKVYHHTHRVYLAPRNTGYRTLTQAITGYHTLTQAITR